MNIGIKDIKELELLFKELKRGKDRKQLQKHYKKVDTVYSHFTNDTLSYKDENSKKLANRFFTIWQDKREDFDIDTFDDADSYDEIEHEENMKQQADQFYDDFYITEADDAIYQEKLKVRDVMLSTKDIMLKKQELLQHQSESLKQAEEHIDGSLKTLKNTNKNLQTAYKCNTKTKINKIKGCTTAIGAGAGTLVVPVGGTIVGTGIGYVFGNKIGNWIEKKTEKNFNKMNTDK